MGTEHQQTWVRVNAQVDKGVAEVVTLLNSFKNLQTVDSCEGIRDGVKPAHVYFYYGDWHNLGHFMFDVLAPRLVDAIGNDALASVEVFNGSTPMGKLSFEPEACPKVASVLRQLASARSLPCFDDTECTSTHNY